MKRQLNIPTNLSIETVFQIIETHLDGRYKTFRKSDLRLIIKKTYKFQSNGREVIMKQLSFNDSGYFQILDNTLTLKINLTKQLIFWISVLVVGLLIFWKYFLFPIQSTILLICLPILIVWVFEIISLNDFIKNELNEISKKMKDSIKQT
jgi:hypothetical protein